MKNKYEEKFIVINKKHIQKLPFKTNMMLMEALRGAEKHIPENNYYVCNQDEPYSDKVIETILSEGENINSMHKLLTEMCKYAKEYGDFMTAVKKAIGEEYKLPESYNKAKQYLQGNKKSEFYITEDVLSGLFSVNRKLSTGLIETSSGYETREEAEKWIRDNEDNHENI